MEFFENRGSGFLKHPDDDVSYRASIDIIEESPYLEKLISRRDKIIDKLDEYPDSEFYQMRKDELPPILQHIEQLQKNIRKNVLKITKEQYERLPIEVKEIVILLNY